MGQPVCPTVTGLMIHFKIIVSKISYGSEFHRLIMLHRKILPCVSFTLVTSLFHWMASYFITKGKWKCLSYLLLPNPNSNPNPTHLLLSGTLLSLSVSVFSSFLCMFVLPWLITFSSIFETFLFFCVVGWPKLNLTFKVRVYHCFVQWYFCISVQLPNPFLRHPNTYIHFNRC